MERGKQPEIGSGYLSRYFSIDSRPGQSFTITADTAMVSKFRIITRSIDNDTKEK